MDKIGEFKNPALISGQHPGLPNQQIPLWERGSNVIFEDQGVKPAPGQSALFVGLDANRVTGLRALTLLISGTPTPAVVWGSQTKLFKGVTPPTTVDVTRLAGPYTGSVTNLWSIVQFGEGVFATNGKDKIQYLSPVAANFVDINTVSDLATTFRARLLAVNGPYLLAFNTDTNPSEFRWCDEDNPFLWTPSAVNSARDIQIRDLLSDIAAVTDFADGILIVGRDQAHFTRFIGAPFFFNNEHLIGGIGAVSSQSILSINRIAYGFGPNSIWETDGATANQISHPSLQRHIYEDTFDAARGEEVVCWLDTSQTRIYWSYPTKDGRGSTICFDRRQRVWSLHDYWRTAGSPGGLWRFPLTAGTVGTVFGEGAPGAEVTGNPSPLQLDMQLFMFSGYGHLGYGGSGYGGFQEVET